MGGVGDEHGALLLQFQAHLGSKGLKNTRQRSVIAQVFFASKTHLSLNDLLVQAQEIHPSIGYATVYRTMKLMTECGVANEHKFADSGLSLYEPKHEDGHHDHLICLTCGLIVEFEDEVIEQRQDEIASRRGFVVKKHRLEIYGECQRAECEHRPPIDPSSCGA